MLKSTIRGSATQLFQSPGLESIENTFTNTSLTLHNQLIPVGQPGQRLDTVQGGLEPSLHGPEWEMAMCGLDKGMQGRQGTIFFSCDLRSVLDSHLSLGLTSLLFFLFQELWYQRNLGKLLYSLSFYYQNTASNNRLSYII